MRRLPIILLLLALACTGNGPSANEETVRGITVSTHGNGRDWANDAIVPTFEQLKELGANWVTIHPYAGISSDGTVRFRAIDPQRPPEHIVRPIREAHRLGLKVLIKPHLAYWGSPFSWRGEIAFDDDVSWDRFWSSYRDWIVAVAEISKSADAFAVGTELERTVDQHQAWSGVIRAVREVYPGALTYAANWDGYERVPFWGELDAVGIQAYFPLVDVETTASEAAIRDGWARWSERLRNYSERIGKRIVFTELGYNHSQSTAAEPWSSRTDDGGEELQALCTKIALETVENEPSLIGAFLWKWFPEPHPIGRNFRLATPEMRRTIRQAWRP